MLSRIPLRHKMAKNKYQNFYQCKKVIGLLYNLESGKKASKKFTQCSEVLQIKCLFRFPIRQETPCFLRDQIRHWPSQHHFCPVSWDHFHFP